MGFKTAISGLETCYSRARELKLVKNTLQTLIPTMGKEWLISFFFNPTSYTYKGWTSIVHLTTGGNYGKYGYRTPGIFFHPSYGLQVSASVNGHHDYYRHFKPSSAPIGQWTKIVISQVKQENKYIYRIAIGDDTFSVENTQPAQFTDVRVFTSDPWHVAQPGSIKEFKIQSNVCSLGLETCYFRASELKLVKNTLQKKITTMGKEWMISFLFYPTSYTYNGWTSIVHLTTGGNYGKYGYRTPGIFFHPSYGLQVSASVNGHHDYYRHFKPSSAPIGQWTKIVISQVKQENKYIYRIAIGDDTFSVENTQPAQFTDVRVFTSDPWHVAQLGSIKNLNIQSNICK